MIRSNPDRLRRMLFRLGLVAGVAVFLCGCTNGHALPDQTTSQRINKQTWTGYKHLFISRDGRVMRPQQKDTVSEGQAYAMLRAVWMRDKDTFDRCYRWSEDHLSRSRTTGDHLLAWHWKAGRVTERMPASDADIDYALSLLLAESVWKGQAPETCEPYGIKADRILRDILKLLTAADASGRLYLLPWIVDEDSPAAALLPQNPSYYSPAHFRIFFKRSRDPRWMQLVDTCYYLLNELSRSFDGRRGVGLIPDWCAVKPQGRIVRLPDKSADFGWEAVRIPLRVGLDWHWFRKPAAKELLSGRLAAFIQEQWKANAAVYSVYAYDGTCPVPYENSAYYASYAVVLMVADSLLAGDMLRKNRSWLRTNPSGWFYTDQQEYYVNSLAWVVDGFHAGIIKME